MAGIYRFDFYNLSGTKIAQAVDHLEMTMTRRVNYPGVLQVTFRDDHPVFVDLLKGYYIELWRKDPALGIDWYKEFGGIYRGSRSLWPIGENAPGVPVRELTVVGYNALLDDRIVAYPANTNNRTVFSNVKAETVSKTLVSYNLGSNATTGNGRTLTNTYPNLTVDTDLGRGNSVYWACAHDNLLETLQDLAKIGGGDFEVKRTSGANFVFYWYLGQMGTDRTASVTFSMSRGDMRNPVWLEDEVEERTVAIVGGSGQDDLRTFVVRTGENYVAGSNAREVFVDAKDVNNDANLLNGRGDQRLEDAKQVRDFDFDVVQTQTSTYGLHYFLGDLASAENPFTGDVITVKVDEVSISQSPTGEEEITVKVIEV